MQGGYLEHALHLAKRKEKHTLCVRILAIDLNLPSAALEYMTSLGPHDCLAHLHRFGSVLMRHVPQVWALGFRL